MDFQVNLNPYDCSLSCIIESTSPCSISAITQDGFGYMCHGARAVLGVWGGKYYFRARMGKQLEVNVKREQDILSTDFYARVGVSNYHTAVDELGEVVGSWALGSSGSKAHDGVAEAFCSAWGPGEVVCVYLDLTTAPGSIAFAKNSDPPQHAFPVEVPHRPQESFLPHVLIKNVQVDLDFTGAGFKPYVLPGMDDIRFLHGYQPWQLACTTSHCVSTKPESPPQPMGHEVVVMVGLPGAGKTHWALRHVEEELDRRYVLLGANPILAQMRVLGPDGHVYYRGRLEEIMALVNEVLATLLRIAVGLPRSYILDQTHVIGQYRSARVKPFRDAGFSTRAVVCVCEESTLQQRQHSAFERDSKFVPDEAIAELKVHFSVPEEGPEFDSVEWAELPRERALAVIEESRQQAQRWKKVRAEQQEAAAAPPACATGPPPMPSAHAGPPPMPPAAKGPPRMPSAKAGPMGLADLPV